MNISTSPGGIAASALLLAFATAAAVFGQSPQSATKPQDRAQQGSNLQGQQGMEQIGNAYKQLHQVTLSALQEEARGWKDKPADRTARGTASASTSLSLRGEELLIAGCPEGLLAGAPNGDARKPATLPADDGKQGTQPNPDRSSQTVGAAGSDGQSVGMLLVCAHSTGGATAGLEGATQKAEKELREASGDRAAAARNAAGVISALALKPGVYCVKQSGASVWLIDQEGQTVLRTTLDAQRGNKSPKASDVGGQEREPDLAVQRAGSQGDWEHVFGAIAKEAMNSMGWAKQGALASMR